MVMISMCGICCDKCGAYLATITDDDKKRQEIAVLWSEQYGADIKPKDINCSGCASREGVVFSHCNVCEIRACGIEKGVENCAHCDEYICEKLDTFFEMVPPCREQLNRICAALNQK